MKAPQEEGASGRGSSMKGRRIWKGARARGVRGFVLPAGREVSGSNGWARGEFWNGALIRRGGGQLGAAFTGCSQKRA
eukprot:8057770-Pyramimonas_sp.AAC.1